MLKRSTIQSEAARELELSVLLSLEERIRSVFDPEAIEWSLSLSDLEADLNALDAIRASAARPPRSPT